LVRFSCAASQEKKLVCVLVPGSGKILLSFDTIYAEGQRRYVETFSAYARQFWVV
jgi:excinuclease ABC subunit A